jgi:pimeloyl-ACP methyl ester carboxylesterase
MATYALIHGGAHGGSCWDLLASELRDRGHDVVAPDLPIDDPEATLTDHAQVVVDAVGDRSDVVVVAHSLGGLVGPIVASMCDAELLVMLAAMVPSPGESCVELWAATDYAPGVPDGDGGKVDVDLDGDDATILESAGAIAEFYHDVQRDIALDAVSKLREQDMAMMTEPWPLAAWPDVPTRYLLCRDDRILPPDWSRRVVPERLGITPDEIDGSHSPFLARPSELADRLEAYRAGLASVR